MDEKKLQTLEDTTEAYIDRELDRLFDEGYYKADQDVYIIPSKDIRKIVGSIYIQGCIYELEKRYNEILYGDID